MYEESLQAKLDATVILLGQTLRLSIPMVVEALNRIEPCALSMEEAVQLAESLKPLQKTLLEIIKAHKIGG